MSKSLKIILIFLFLSGLTMPQFSPIQSEVKGDSATAVITEASTNSITFEVKVPIEEVFVEIIQIQNQTFSKPNLPGFQTTSQTGAPQLPFLTQVLGVPFDGEISISVKPGKTIRQKLNAPIVPVTSESVEWDLESLTAETWGYPVVINSTKPDPEIYNSNAIFPGILSEVSNDAILRSQRLVSVAVYPIQYDPAASELFIYHSLMVTVEFSGFTVEKQGDVKAEPFVFEKFFEDNLLNYEQAKTWRENIISNPIDGITAAQAPWSPPDPGWRIKVHDTGFYKITFPELLAAGVPIGSFDIDTLRMYYLGEEIAIKEIPGEAIVFYGESIDSKYTADNVYWLTYGGNAGLRMEPVDGTPTGGTVPVSFLSQDHLEQDQWYRSQVPGDDALDRFLWGRVIRNGSTVYPWNYSFAIDNHYDGDLLMSISLIGYMEVESINPDHRAGISVNGTQLADVTWDGFRPLQVDLIIPENLLLPSENTLEVTALPTEYSQDVFFIDWLDFVYDRTFASESGRLDFTYEASDDWQFVLTDFPTNSIDVYDISSALTPKWIENVEVTGESANFSAVFHDQILSAKDYLALHQNSYLSVESIETDTPSDLFSESIGADYLMISHQGFLGAAAALQAQKTAQGLRTELIDVKDIYDEFGYGIEDPNAIRSFIAYAYENWVEPAPAYVLLIGDGHFDPKNNLGYGRTSFIPPFLAKCDPTIGETAADNRYVSIIGDDELPDLMLGRLSVNTELEAQSIINKIIAYENNPPEGDWQRQILAVTDNLDTAHYPLISESLLQDHFPSEPFEATKVYWQWTHYDLDAARADIQNAFNEGIFLVNYIGHAYYSGWASELLFTTNHIVNLQPQDELPIILAMTCLEGYFISPNLYSSNQEAMGEVITRTEGKGAVASWSPTGWGSVYGHDTLNRGVFRAIYQDGIRVLSGALNSGILNLWATGDNLDLLETSLLFGDPAMQMNLSLTAVRDNYSVNEDEILSIAAEQGVLMNDINPDNDPLTVILVDDVFEGSLDLHEDGSFVYAPDPDFYGSDSFSYKVNNGVIDSNTVIVQIYVNPVNDPPIAEDQVVTTLINTPVEIELTAIDDESGIPSKFWSNFPKSHTLDHQIEADLLFEVLTQPTHGSLSGDLPFLVYTPDESFAGIDHFTFKVNDGEYDSNTAIVTIYVNLSSSVFLPLISKP